MTLRVAVLVDGDNLSPVHAENIHKIARRFGQIDISRVYLNAQSHSAWHDATAYHLIHSGTGKNATDLLLAIDGIEFALQRDIATIVIASSDGDFVHLHRRLREHGVTTVGAGEAKTPEVVRNACSKFCELEASSGSSRTDEVDEPVSEMDRQIRTIIAANSKNGAGMRLTILGAKMHRQHGVKISESQDKTWRRYLQSKPELYDLDEAGQNANVRFKPQGFSRQA